MKDYRFESFMSRRDIIMSSGNSHRIAMFNKEFNREMDSKFGMVSDEIKNMSDDELLAELEN